MSINGANRLGSNSLPELLVFGRRAGRAAAEYASQGFDINPHVIAQKTDEHRRLEHDLLNKSGTERIADLRDAMQQAMEQGAGIYRTAATVKEAVERVQRLRERYADIAVDDRSKTFNTERVAALELGFMLDIADAIVNAALRREESRGAHQRTDFPKRNDDRFLAHSLIWREADGSSRVEYLPVTITRWPPAERVYGEAAPHGGANQVTGRKVSSGAGV